MLTAERLRELFHYNQTTGEFTRIKPRKGSRLKVGTLSNGYVIIGVDFAQYFAHRLAWLWMTGEWPKFSVDHINRRRSDNRWVNLRDVPHQVNRLNQGLQKNNTSGVAGLSWDKKNRMWVVHMNFRDRSVAEEAVRLIGALRHTHFESVADKQH